MKALSPRVCTACGSAAVQQGAPGWHCTRCGHSAKAFPFAHAQIDPDAYPDDRVTVGTGGRMRRGFHLDDD